MEQRVWRAQRAIFAPTLEILLRSARMDHTHWIIGHIVLCVQQATVAPIPMSRLSHVLLDTILLVDAQRLNPILWGRTPMKSAVSLVGDVLLGTLVLTQRLRLRFLAI